MSSIEQETLILQFAGSTVAVECTGNASIGLAKFLFGAVPVGEVSPTTVTYQLISTDTAGEFLAICKNSGHTWRGTVGLIGSILMDQITYHFADQTNNGSLFHAAAVGKSNATSVVIPGSSGSGKSTLSLWFVQNGYELFTDELVFFPLGFSTFQALPRPVHLKNGTDKLFSDLSLFSTISVRDGESLVQAATAVPPDASASCFLFPAYQPGSANKLIPLSAGDASLELVRLLVNGRSLPDHGFPEVLRIARALPAWRLIYGGFSGLDGLLSKALR